MRKIGCVCLACMDSGMLHAMFHGIAAESRMPEFSMSMASSLCDAPWAAYSLSIVCCAIITTMLWLQKAMPHSRLIAVITGNNPHFSAGFSSFFCKGRMTPVPSRIPE